jgi:uncharacterized protein YeaO (DUF488 family)
VPGNGDADGRPHQAGLRRDGGGRRLPRLIDHVWPRGISKERARERPLTIVYAARDTEHNNAVVLAGLLREG